MYTPADEFEERVPVTFIRKIQSTLQERSQESHEQVGKSLEPVLIFQYNVLNSYLSLHCEKT